MPVTCTEETRESNKSKGGITRFGISSPKTTRILIYQRGEDENEWETVEKMIAIASKRTPASSLLTYVATSLIATRQPMSYLVSS